MLTGWRLTLSKCFVIPQRYVLGLMGFLAVVNAYNMRVCLSVAITAMTTPIVKNATENMDSCPAPEGSHNSSSSGTMGTYNWDSGTQGIILSAFFWGYVVTHMPGGILAEKFGGKHSLGLGIFGTAVFTLLTPIVVKYWDWQGLIVIRVLEGLGEGTTYPALNAMLAQWVPSNERAKIGTLVYAGGQIGTVVGNAVSGALIDYTQSWESVFYLFGALGLLWYIIWSLICYSTPAEHPFISDNERTFLEKEIGANTGNKDNMNIPWKAILMSVPLWALVFAQIGHDWGFFIMVTDLPIYMSEVLKFNIKDNGILSSLPYIVMWIMSMLSAWLCDWLIDRNTVTVSFARKLFTTIASIGPAVFIIAASYAGCDKITVVALFCIGMGLMGTFYPGMKVNALDLSSNYAGTIMAIVNGIGAIAGIVTPILVGNITQNHTVAEWQIVFWISFAVLVVTNIIFVIFASADEQWWNKPQEERYMSENNKNKLNEITITKS
ncbi:Dietary and metabolic glutamate transporter [Carabus blaptoides fortunei]